MSPRTAGGGQKIAPSTTAGVIHVNPAALQPAAPKSTPRLKLIIRRLPPALTRDEFESAFGPEWKVGAGKVDWFEYRSGKIRSTGKTPEQSRAYIRLTGDVHVPAFESKFMSIVFHDAKGTHRHPDLKHLPPALEFAPCQRVAPVKSRQDNRQGLIDQDPEYMAFLEGITHAIPKAPSLDTAAVERNKDTIKSTPLIEALREKKAAKAKAAAAKAVTKKPDETSSPQKTKATTNKGSKATATDAKTSAKLDGKNREAIKPATKEGKPASVSTDKAGSASGNANGTPAKAKRERAPASIKSMLERDLGLNPSPRRAAKAGTRSTEVASLSSESASLTSDSPSSGSKSGRSAKRDKDPASNASVSDANKAVPAAQAPSRTSRSNPAGIHANGVPAVSAKPDGSHSAPKAVAANTTRANKAASKPNTGSTKAYLKHANASQGITEELLRAALAQFGELVSLDIDKRKGTALAEFKTTDGLGAAMAKRSVSVAQGAVEVLEYRDKPGTAKNTSVPGRASPRGGRGRGGRGGASERSPAAAAAPATTGAG
ncbi:hypothetical protein ANO11243_030270 [Dothideomycetidae sp. 11243]|nr:hypothetical protein ANO11243_030270 [fungal sp. No.11243]